MKTIKWFLWGRWWFIRTVKRVGGISKEDLKTLIRMHAYKPNVTTIKDMFYIIGRYK